MTLERTAYHEAGHAVMARLLGRRVQRVSVVKDDEALGRVTHYPPGDWFRPDITFDGRTRNLIEDHIMILWAGTLTEARHGSSTAEELKTGAANDMETIGDLATRGTGSTDEATAYAEWLRHRALGTMNNPRFWPSVEAVAEALLTTPQLGARKLRDILDAADPLRARTARR